MLKQLSNNVGIFGGSFDPPHTGHVLISKISIKKLKLQKVVWIVTKKNPFKKKYYFTLKDRVSKSKKITSKLKKVQVIYLDDKIGSNRTINVINYLKKTQKKINLFLILGSDNLINFHKWTSWKKIVKLSKLVVFSRKGYDLKSKNSKIVKYLKQKNIIFIKNKHINISSSGIKKKLRKLD